MIGIDLLPISAFITKQSELINYTEIVPGKPPENPQTTSMQALLKSDFRIGSPNELPRGKPRGIKDRNP
jgi:hypothetical protein